ncbi:Ppx/GppA phosphatase family protein [Sulfurovum sp. XTW-4]|uniref:Ppx/GppA phosphatase family protein n=1 Tax=Sulfurovum xiamenensis TaxID=3019066 RepID=A0ABT7QQF2_9BACT|nr:Ppx/GppA phosphatase family protein [Sulfurovum xiamenensis]MDM5262987.1 Ppx/GppA phosphatase family protein [Sulfurovum xiamenensis]
MSKRTAIIDIGSNSARLVIFEKTSRYGFHLICEQKSKVRIGEAAYEKEGYLQPIGIKRAYFTLKSFLHTIDKYQANKTLCIATSALRDAPNGKEFVQWIQKELGLSIKVIDGNKEAKYGGIAAVNLLPISEGISIDIGGGSSDMTLIKHGYIVDTYSLDLGTVRLKELFFDKGVNPSEINEKAKAYIQHELEKLPEHFRHTLAIGIGGTARTLSKGIMKQVAYPLDKLHAFTYNVSEHRSYLDAIPLSSAKNLKRFGLKKNRYDTIREGTLIFNEILSHIGTETVISSAAGVREGVYLEQLLKKDNLKFPSRINPSVTSILDRFQPLVNIQKNQKTKRKLASNLYTVLQQDINDNKQYEKELLWAVKLSSIGQTLTVYRSHQHAFYIAMQELNHGFTHEEILLISFLLRMNEKELLNKPLFTHYKPLLPEKSTLLWLSFIYTLTVLLQEASNNAGITFTYTNKTLRIISDKPLYLAKEKVKALEKPIPFAIIIEDESTLPKNKKLGI